MIRSKWCGARPTPDRRSAFHPLINLPWADSLSVDPQANSRSIGQARLRIAPIARTPLTTDTRGGSGLRTRVLVHSGFAESAGEAVEDRLHHVLEKRTLSGLDVNVGGHPRRRDEIRHAPENFLLVQAHPNDVEFRTRVGTRFGLYLHLLRQGVR